MPAKYHGELTASVQRAINDLLRPGEEFDVCDLVDLLSEHATFFGAHALTRHEINWIVAGLSQREDQPVLRLSRGRYRFCGFGQGTMRGHLRARKYAATTLDRGVCPHCFMAVPTSGSCDCLDTVTP